MKRDIWVQQQPVGRSSVNILHLGDQNTGKSVFVRQMCQKQHEQNKMGVIVLDYAYQKEYSNIPTIKIEEIPYLKQLPFEKQMVKVHLRQNKQQEDFDNFCHLVNFHTSNFFVVMEDLSSYTDALPRLPLKALINNNRNIGNDYVFTYHSFSEVPPFLLKKTQVFWIRQTLDDPADMPKKIPPMLKPRITEALKLVISENLRFHSEVPNQPKLAFRELIK